MVGGSECRRSKTRICLILWHDLRIRAKCSYEAGRLVFQNATINVYSSKHVIGDNEWSTRGQLIVIKVHKLMRCFGKLALLGLTAWMESSLHFSIHHPPLMKTCLLTRRYSILGIMKELVRKEDFTATVSQHTGCKTKNKCSSPKVGNSRITLHWPVYLFAASCRTRQSLIKCGVYC